MRYEPWNFYLRSTEEMETLFSAYPQAVENTQRIADAASWSLPSASTTCRNSSCRRDTIRPPTCASSVTRALPRRYGQEKESYRKQLAYELDMIEKMGFTDYFLIVSDFVRYAKSVGIPVGSRAALLPGAWCPTVCTSRTSTPWSITCISSDS